MAQIKTGIESIDDNINGGIKQETVTVIYGEPETGKTTLVMQCAINCAKQHRKILFIDCDNTFSAKRLSQIAKDAFDEIADQVVLVKPKDFKEQTVLIDHISDYTKNVGLIIIDTFTSLYGARVCESTNKVFTVNRELNRQLAILAQIAKIQKIPVMITSQVRCVLNDQTPNIRPVATRVLTFWADNIIALKPTESPLTIKAILEKTHGIDKEVVCYVQIGESGIEDTQLR